MVLSFESVYGYNPVAILKWKLLNSAFSCLCLLCCNPHHCRTSVCTSTDFPHNRVQYISTCVSIQMGANVMLFVTL